MSRSTFSSTPSEPLLGSASNDYGTDSSLDPIASPTGSSSSGSASTSSLLRIVSPPSVAIPILSLASTSEGPENETETKDPIELEVVVSDRWVGQSPTSRAALLLKKQQQLQLLATAREYKQAIEIPPSIPCLPERSGCCTLLGGLMSFSTALWMALAILQNEGIIGEKGSGPWEADAGKGFLIGAFLLSMISFIACVRHASTLPPLPRERTVMRDPAEKDDIQIRVINEVGLHKEDEIKSPEDLQLKADETQIQLEQDIAELEAIPNIAPIASQLRLFGNNSSLINLVFDYLTPPERHEPRATSDSVSVTISEGESKRCGPSS